MRQCDPDFLAAEKAQQSEVKQVHGWPRKHCNTVQINLRVKENAHFPLQVPEFPTLHGSC